MKTLPQNLKDNFENRHNVEFVVADIGSTDGLREWMFDEFQEYLKLGYLKYFPGPKTPFFHMSKAKNFAHRMAQGRILSNLDADNFTGHRAAQRLIKLFFWKRDEIVFWQWSGHHGDGTSGALTYTREHFWGVGGYDEMLEPLGYEEKDLLHRLLTQFSLQLVNTGQRTSFRKLVFTLQAQMKGAHFRPSRSIQHPKSLSIQFAGTGLSYEDMVTKNKIRSRSNILLGKLIANRGLRVC